MKNLNSLNVISYEDSKLVLYNLVRQVRIMAILDLEIEVPVF